MTPAIDEAECGRGVEMRLRHFPGNVSRAPARALVDSLRLVTQTLFGSSSPNLRRSLMVAQAFLQCDFYLRANSIDFLTSLPIRSRLYLLPFAIGNFLGPVLIGRMFDTHGRRIMIAFTYIASGLLLALTGWLFVRNLIDATTQTACWTIIFFFASCAASSAYLTVSETFPLEIRALAIAFF
jgi:MFS family permease